MKSDYSVVLNQALAKKSLVQKAVQDIKGYKAGQKKLYKTFYQAQEEMKAYVESHKADSELYKILQEVCEVDTTELFYKSNT